MAQRFLERLLAAKGRPLVVAHRGDSFRAPENTIEAARLAWEAGAEAWELDVQLSRDGVPVLLHDESLARTTNVAERFGADPRRLDGFRVAEFDWNELQTLDAGSWFVAADGPARSARRFGTLNQLEPAQRERYASGQVRLPTLREALALTRELNWLVNVELKSFPECPPGLLEAVLDEIAWTETADRVLFSCFDHCEIARVPGMIRDRHPGLAGIPSGALTSTPLHRPLDYLTRTVGAACYHPSADALGSASIDYRRRPGVASLRLSDVDELIAHNVPILVYTVNDRRPDGLARHLADLNVSGLFTDDPRGMRELFDSQRF